MKKQIIFSIVGLLILTFGQTAQILAQSSGGAFEIKQSVVANGGGRATGGSFTLDGTAGQSAAGEQMTGGNFSVSNGFWAGNSNVVTPINRTRFDFDGDGKADQSVFRPADGNWYLMRSAQGFIASLFGISTDKLVPADYDGDGKTDIAVYRAGVWYWLNSSNNTVGSMQWGAADDIPVPANYDADTKDNIAVFRPSNGGWYILNADNVNYISLAFGANGDKPVVADYDGDGKSDVAVFRPSTGTWYLQRSAQGFTGIAFGAAADKPVVGDYDGDGKADLAVFRPSDSGWYVQRSSLGFLGVQFGAATDLPTAADYDGDGKTDIAVFRAGNWYRLNSSNGQFQAANFGNPTDKPIPSAYIY